MSVRRLSLAVPVAIALSSGSALAGTKDYAMKGYAMPADKPVTVVLLQPDVQVGQLQAGGVVEPNADWTNAARANLAEALKANQAARRIDFKVFNPDAPEAQQIVAEYEALHQAVAGSIIEFAYGSKLPTKKARGGKSYVFDWTLGPGAQRIGEMSGGTYGLFLFTRDNFASASRKAMQAAGILGCFVGFCAIVTGGQHIAYASLVELETGNIVWFNILRGSKGDIRETDGAQGMVDAIMASMPTRPGDAPQAKAK
jgi:hypothetical protein